MKNQLKIGSVVGILRTGMVGEIVKIVNKEAQTKYHVTIPSESETYLYSKQDLHLFPAIGEKNIRNEWRQGHEKNQIGPYEGPVSAAAPSKAINNRSANFLDRIKFVMKIIVLTLFLTQYTLVI